ncbi:hypothetical protein FN846DRAFT_893498 [Sphaerosporella brunnea]|uniref:Uncharacterized protein n=1 Tax=Sphaerosporella brunnea TaxID=1250544 RepID=A0A5J5EM12_9PEZI|nr:hypothetical protein FN846DRAFT_893498 [Sphaerosporella brunnea]
MPTVTLPNLQTASFLLLMPGCRKPEFISHGRPQQVEAVKVDEDVIVRDNKTGEIVFIVIRNFCADSAVLEWANNIVGTESTALREFEYVRSCTFALLWNMVKSKIPEEILSDVKKFLRLNYINI